MRSLFDEIVPTKPKKLHTLFCKIPIMPDGHRTLLATVFIFPTLKGVFLMVHHSLNTPEEYVVSEYKTGQILTVGETYPTRKKAVLSAYVVAKNHYEQLLQIVKREEHVNSVCRLK